MSINCSVISRVIALSNMASSFSFFFRNNYPQNIINRFSDIEVNRQKVCYWTGLRRMSWKRMKIKTFLRAVTIKQLSFGGKCKEGRNVFHVFVFHVCSARKKRGTCYWAAFSSVWSFYPENQITFFNPKILGFLLLRKTTLRGEWNVKN